MILICDLPYTSYTSGAINGRQARNQFIPLTAARRIQSFRYLVPSPKHHKWPHQYQSKDPLPLQPSHCCVGESLVYPPPIWHSNLHHSPILLDSLGVGHDVVQLLRQKILQGSTFTTRARKCQQQREVSTSTNLLLSFPSDSPELRSPRDGNSRSVIWNSDVLAGCAIGRVWSELGFDPGAVVVLALDDPGKGHCTGDGEGQYESGNEEHCCCGSGFSSW